MPDLFIASLLLGLMLAGFTLGYTIGFRNRRAAERPVAVSRAWVSGFRAGLEAAWSDVEVVRNV